MGEPWRTLGIAPTRDQAEIRRAYAKILKQTNPEDDAQGFQHLRQSYELARQLASYIGDDHLLDDELLLEADAPVIAPATPQEFARPDDPAGIALDVALAALGQELRSEPPATEARLDALLDAVLNCDLERFDLMQRAEQQLLDLLVTNTPRSDPLLGKANARFEWSLRKEDHTLPMEARVVLARRAELEQLRTLEEGASHEAKAFARLRAPPHPLQRFLRAHLLELRTTKSEVALIRRLRAECPNILRSLNPESLAWWTRYMERPHFSVLTVLIAFIPAFIVAQIVRHALAPPNTMYGLQASSLPWGAALSIAIALARLYAIEWPVTIAEQRWPWRKPLWFSFGWLPAVALLLIVSAFALAQPWVSITVAALMCLLAWWAVIAAGPIEPLFAGTGVRLWVENSRLVQIGLTNIASGIWFIAMLAEYRLPWPLTLTVVAAMCASGVSRPLQLQGFVSYLGRWQRLAYLGALLVIAIALGVAAVNFATVAQWQLPLFVGTVCLVILRRPVVFALNLAEGATQMVWLALIVGFNMFRAVAKSFVPESDANGTTVLIGALLMLSGVAIAAIAAIRVNRH